MPPAASAAALLFEDTSGGFGEGGTAWTRRLSARGSPPDRASTRLARACSQALASGDERGGAEPKLAELSADDEPLDPAAGAGGLDKQVQAVAVGVPSGRCGADEGGRERRVGMASSALRQGKANTNSVLLPLGVVSSGVSWRNRVPWVTPPAPTARYWRPSTL